MLFKKAARSKLGELGATELARAVRRSLPNADDETVGLVASIAGLLGQVAYADRDYAEVEDRAIRAELGRVNGLDASGVDAICAVLKEHAVTVAKVEGAWYSRFLREHADRDFRVQILQALVDLAAADHVITIDEANTLRRVATSLGLTQEDYNAAQERHRDKLSVLR